MSHDLAEPAGREERGEGETGETGETDDPRCDFCGEAAPNVRRVALDEGYDRLNQRHRVRYACPSCSERKEAERQGR